MLHVQQRAPRLSCASSENSDFNFVYSETCIDIPVENESLYLYVYLHDTVKNYLLHKLHVSLQYHPSVIIFQHDEIQTRTETYNHYCTCTPIIQGIYTLYTHKMYAEINLFFQDLILVHTPRTTLLLCCCCFFRMTYDLLLATCVSPPNTHSRRCKKMPVDISTSCAGPYSSSAPRTHPLYRLDIFAREVCAYWLQPPAATPRHLDPVHTPSFPLATFALRSVFFFGTSPRGQRDPAPRRLKTIPHTTAHTSPTTLHSLTHWRRRNWRVTLSLADIVLT